MSLLTAGEIDEYQCSTPGLSICRGETDFDDTILLRCMVVIPRGVTIRPVAGRSKRRHCMKS